MSAGNESHPEVIRLEPPRDLLLILIVMLVLFGSMATVFIVLHPPHKSPFSMVLALAVIGLGIHLFRLIPVLLPTYEIDDTGIRILKRSGKERFVAWSEIRKTFFLEELVTLTTHEGKSIRIRLSLYEKTLQQEVRRRIEEKVRAE